ncbi:pilus assembly protein TadG-related protein [Azospirillum sp.]|uniref:pilus assembly protein TadG-related protein n=1 Tax=Azospirillum sp. TaxID=34012 RepID=UPI003D731C89
MSLYYPYPLGQPARPSLARRLAFAALLLLLVPLAGAVGYGVDAVRGYMVQARLMRAVDEAALAGGRVLFDNQRDGHIRKFFETAFPAGFLGAEPAPLAIADNPADGTLTVRGTAVVHSGLLRLLGFQDFTLEARSVVRRASRNGEVTAVVRRTTI